MNTTRQHAAASRWDRLGTWLSGLCVVHCLLLPFVLLLLPAGSLVFDAYHGAHYVFAALLAPLTIFVVWEAWQGRRDGLSMILLVAGLAALFVALLFHEAQDVVLHTALTRIGSAMLIAGHLLHLRHAPCDEMEAGS